MLYIIVFLMLLFSIIANSGGHYSSKRLFSIAVFILIVYSALRDAFIYPDIAGYNEVFNYGQNNSTPDTEVNGGYLLLNKICAGIFPSFQFLLLIISIIVISCYSIVIKRYSPYIWFSLLLYLLINYYPSFFLLRQYLAIAVFLYSLKFVIKRDLLGYAICMLIAYSFHSTAIVTAPIYFLYGLKKTKMNMVLLFGLSVAVVFLFYSLGSYINMISAYYAHYFEEQMDEPAWQRAIMKVFVFLLYLFAVRGKYYNEGINRIVFYCMVMNVTICVAAMSVEGVYRLREYFALADFIGIPIIYKEAHSALIPRKQIVVFAVLFYITLLVISFNNFVVGENMNNSYRFFWNNR